MIGMVGDATTSAVGREDPGVGMTESDRAALAVLVSTDGIGPVTLERLLAAGGPPSRILGLAARPDGRRRLLAEIARHFGRGLPEGLDAVLAAAVANRSRVLERIAALDLQVVVQGDDSYPARLRGVEMPPAVLFVRGDTTALNQRRSVAVVGTRRPTDAGRRIASRLGMALTRAGAVVVSGLAIGIDGAAHAAVLEAGGRTVAFIGGGHGRLYPFAHDRLADAIAAAGGAVVSEYGPDVQPSKGTFPRRNRLISGSADAVVVVEAGARSGALVTASWALEQGRECFVVPGSIDAPMSAGCLGFLRDWPGAARIVAGIPQLLDDLGLPAEAALPRPAPARAEPSSTIRSASAGATVKALDPTDERVAVAVARGAATVDELVAVTHVTVPEALGALTRLEAGGLVRGAYGRYEAIGEIGPGSASRRARRPAPTHSAALPPAA